MAYESHKIHTLNHLWRKRHGIVNILAGHEDPIWRVSYAFFNINKKRMENCRRLGLWKETRYTPYNLLLHFQFLVPLKRNMRHVFVYGIVLQYSVQPLVIFHDVTRLSLTLHERFLHFLGFIVTKSVSSAHVYFFFSFIYEGCLRIAFIS